MKQLLIVALFLSLISSNIFAQEYIEMRKESSGIYTIPCEVNGLRLRFVFDTGASAVSISLTEATFMLKNGYIDENDIVGTTNVQTADGKIAENYTLNLKELKIGSVTLKNVKAVVSSGIDAPLLLGQSVLDKLGHWSFQNSMLVLNDYSSDEGGEITWEQVESMLNKGDKNKALNILRESVRDGNDYAAYLFLFHVAKAKEASKALLNDTDVAKAMQILQDSINNGSDDTYQNYDRLIWFALYRLNDSDLALSYFKKIESKNILSKDMCDRLADDIILYSGWSTGKMLEDNEMNLFFQKGYYRAYTTYANYWDEIKNMPTKAFQAYKKAADVGYIPASVKLGICYMDGHAITRNVSTGLNILDKAAQKGYIEAITELCARYYYGDGVKQNFDKVLEYARLYGNEGYLNLLNEAYKGIAYWGKKEYRYAIQSLEPLTFLISPHHGRNELTAYNSGINRIDREILNALGQMYENGLDCKVDFNKAFDYYTKLVERDPAWGNGMLGDMFFLNELMESNPERAYQYYLLGANNGSGYCCFRLALMNYHGVGTTKNSIKAEEYKSKAIKLGISASDFNF